jgi:hypothetical protein
MDYLQSTPGFCPHPRSFLSLKMERVWQRQYAIYDEARRDINQ